MLALSNFFTPAPTTHIDQDDIPLLPRHHRPRLINKLDRRLQILLRNKRPITVLIVVSASRSLRQPSMHCTHKTRREKHPLPRHMRRQQRLHLERIQEPRDDIIKKRRLPRARVVPDCYPQSAQCPTHQEPGRPRVTYPAGPATRAGHPARSSRTG